MPGACWNVPAGHSTQLPLEATPVVALRTPVLPSEGLYVPTGQFTQASGTVLTLSAYMNLPAAQGVQVSLYSAEEPSRQQEPHRYPLR